MLYYHKSNPIFRDLIAVEGLVPQVGESYELHYNELERLFLEPAVFVCDNKEYDSTWDDDLYEIDTDVIFIEDEHAYEGCFVTYESIPPEDIKLIYKGTGKSLI